MRHHAALHIQDLWGMFVGSRSFCRLVIMDLKRSWRFGIDLLGSCCTAHQINQEICTRNERCPCDAITKAATENYDVVDRRKENQPGKQNLSRRPMSSPHHPQTRYAQNREGIDQHDSRVAPGNTFAALRGKPEGEKPLRNEHKCPCWSRLDLLDTKL